MITVWEFRSIDGKQNRLSIRPARADDQRLQHEYQRIVYRGTESEYIQKLLARIHELESVRDALTDELARLTVDASIHQVRAEIAKGCIPRFDLANQVATLGADSLLP